jgi:hypothetical protein
MLKQFLSTALVLASLTCPSSASILYWETDDMGEEAVKSAIRRKMATSKDESAGAFKVHCNRLQDLKKGFLHLKEAEVVALFGPKIERKPKTFALPIYDSGAMAISGLFSISEPNKCHQDFYEISDFAAAKVFYGRDGEHVRNILFYFRADPTFPRLGDENKLKACIEWENKQLAELEAWIAKRKNELLKKPPA